MALKQDVEEGEQVTMDHSVLQISANKTHTSEEVVTKNCEEIVVTKMQISESEPSTAPSTARSESSDSITSLDLHKMKNFNEQEESYILHGSLDNSNEQIKTMPVTPLNILEVLDDIIDVEETSHDGFWDTSDEDAFVENKNKLMQKVRKVTVVQNSSPWALTGSQTEGRSNLNTLVLGHHEVEEENSNSERKTSEEFFSQDSLEPGAGQDDQRRGRRSRVPVSSSSYSSSTEEEEEDTDKVNFRVISFDATPPPLSKSLSAKYHATTSSFDLAESHLLPIFGFSGSFLQIYSAKL